MSRKTIAELVLVTISRKINENKKSFLFVYNDESKMESYDFVTGLVHYFSMKPGTPAELLVFNKVDRYSGEWTKSINQVKAMKEAKGELFIKRS